MEVGLINVKGSLPCFEDFGNLPTKIINNENYNEIKDLDMLIIPGGSLIESNSINDKLKKNIIEFDSIIIGICSGFQLLSSKIDIGRKNPIPIVKEGLNLLDVEFSPLICTDLVNFNVIGNNLFKNNENNKGKGFHCHTYGNIVINNFKTKPFTYSTVKKLDYKVIDETKILSGVYCKNIFGTMIHNFLDNENIKNNIFNYFKISEDEKNQIYKKNKIIINKLKNYSEKDNAVKYNNSNNNKKGLILLATGSDSGKTFLITSIASKLKGKTFVAKIGPDVRDIVPALYILKEKMTKYSSIKISNRGWCEVEDFIKFVNNSNYNNFIVEGVMGAFTGALNKKNYSGAEISKILNFPVFVVSPCNKSGIEGAFIESISYCSLLSEMGVNVKGIILNKVYNFELFEKVKKIGEEKGLKIIGIPKITSDKRGLIPEIEIDYEEFCKYASNLNINIDLPDIILNRYNSNNNNNYEDINDFEYYLKKWCGKL